MRVPSCSAASPGCLPYRSGCAAAQNGYLFNQRNKRRAGCSSQARATALSVQESSLGSPWARSRGAGQGESPTPSRVGSLILAGGSPQPEGAGPEVGNPREHQNTPSPRLGLAPLGLLGRMKKVRVDSGWEGTLSFSLSTSSPKRQAPLPALGAKGGALLP